MPTKKPSLHIVVDEDIAQLYKRCARLQNRSVSNLIGELLVEIAPTIGTLTETLEMAHGLPKETLLKIASDMAQGEEYFHAMNREASQYLEGVIARAKASGA